MVELALTPDQRWPASAAEVVDAVVAAGFDALGTRPGWLDEGVVASFVAAPVRCHEVLALTVGDDEAATLASAESLAATAAAFGAEWVLTVFVAPLGPATASVIRRCAARFAEVGAGLAIEPSPLGPVSTIAEGMDVVRVAETAGRAGLLIDTWHFSNGADTWEDLGSVPLEAIAYLQFDDALPPEAGRSLMAETLYRRTVPGEGVFDLSRFAGCFLDRGWDGTVSVEVLNPDLATMEVREVTRLLFDSTARYWR